MRWLFLFSLALAGGCSLFDAAGSEGGSEVCESMEPERSATATWDPNIMGGGNCSYGPSEEILVAGVSADAYDDSAGCGGCLEVTRPGRATVLVRVVDSCIGCPDGTVVLSEGAFTMLEPNIDVGVIDVDWRWVECPVEGAIGIHFIRDSNVNWLAVQVRNHRHRIASLEARATGADSWLALTRATYNYFIADAGLGAGPFDFRVTDRYGHVLEENGMELGMDVVRTGSAQFPSCE